jgi:hypothetical protein
MANPTLLSFLRADSPSTTAAPLVRYRLTFSEPVTGLAADAFALRVTGSLAGAAVTGISAVEDSGGAVWLVSVATGMTGAGNLQIVFDPADVTNANGEHFAQPTSRFTAGGTPAGNLSSYGVAAGDLDGDGDIDLVTTDSTADTVSVLLNDGTGAFVTTHYAASAAPLGSTLTDLNGDGRLDIVTGPWLGGDGMMSIRLGGEAGAFGDRLTVAVPEGAWRIGAADLDGDGHVDLIVPDTGGGMLRVLYGLGDGSLSAPVSYAIGNSPLVARTADLNGDGAADVVVTNNGGGSLSVMLNDGRGVLGPQVAYATDLEPRDALPVDLDGDGDLDLVVSSGTAGLTVLTNAGDGSFTYGTALALPNAGYGLVAGDLDGDGTQDLVVGMADGIAILLGTGGGGFAPALTRLSGAFYFQVALGDLDGDGWTDIVGAGGRETVSILKNNPLLFTAPAYGIDHIVPTGTAVLAQPEDPLLTTVTYTITFSEAVTGLQSSSFALLRTGSATGQVTAFAGSGANYQVTIGNITGRGTLQLHLPAAAGVADAVGNAVAWTDPVAHGVERNLPPGGSVTIAGTAERGQVLTASNSLTDPDGLGPVAYQWQREEGGSFGDIVGATGASYALLREDIGHGIRVVASYLDGGGTVESRSSAALGPVAARTIPLAPPVDGVSDTPGLDSAAVAARLADGDLLVPPPGTVIVLLADGELDFGGGTEGAYLTRLYRGLLGRPGDPLGLEFWAHAEGLDSAAVAQAFIAAPEYAGPHAGEPDAVFLDSIFGALLGRDPDPQGEAFYSAQLSAGVSRGQVVATIASSGEAQQFWAPVTDPGTFLPAADLPLIRAAYATGLGRAVDPSGLAFSRGQLGAGVTPALLADGIAGSAEFLARHGAQDDRSFILQLYADGLGRVPGEPEIAYFQGVLAAGDRGDALLVFAESVEAQGRLDWAL